MRSLSERDAANIKFDEDVANFVPLDIESVRLAAQQNSDPRYDSPQADSMITNGKLTELQKCMLRVVLTLHESVFRDKSTIGKTKLVEHSVATGDHRPVQQKQYPIPTVAMDEIRRLPRC